MAFAGYEDFAGASAFRATCSATVCELLLDEGVFTRRLYSERPERLDEYRLTEKGMALYPILVALGGWGDAFKVSEPPITYTHRTCGHECHPRLTCDHCGEPIDPRQVAAHPAPDAFQRVPEKVCR